MTNHRLLRRTTVRHITLAGLFLALGYLLPFLTGQIPEIGKMLLPMHLPVLLCGLICGARYGFFVGLILPLTRSLFFSMPVFYPTALSMSFELAAYGLLVGLFFSLFRKQNLFTLYASLIGSMLAGRAVWGVVQTILLAFGSESFPFAAFLSGAFLSAFPGILLQLILIPAVMLILDRTRILPFRQKENRQEEP